MLGTASAEGQGPSGLGLSFCHCLGALQAPGRQGHLPCWQRGRLSHQGPLVASGSACEAPHAPPGLALSSSTLGSLGSASHDGTLTEELLLVDEERGRLLGQNLALGKMPQRRLKYSEDVDRMLHKRADKQGRV